MPQHKKTASSSDKASLTLSADLQASYPASSKKYLQTDDNLHVPFRYISQSDTLTEQGRVQNPEIAVYDTSGQYSDESYKHDLVEGLPKLRQAWIKDNN